MCRVCDAAAVGIDSLPTPPMRESEALRDTYRTCQKRVSMTMGRLLLTPLDKHYLQTFR